VADAPQAPAPSPDVLKDIGHAGGQCGRPSTVSLPRSASSTSIPCCIAIVTSIRSRTPSACTSSIRDVTRRTTRPPARRTGRRVRLGNRTRAPGPGRNQLVELGSRTDRDDVPYATTYLAFRDAPASARPGLVPAVWERCGKTSARGVPSGPDGSQIRPENHDPRPSDPGFCRSLNLLVEGSIPPGSAATARRAGSNSRKRCLRARSSSRFARLASLPRGR